MSDYLGSQRDELPDKAAQRPAYVNQKEWAESTGGSYEPRPNNHPGVKTAKAEPAADEPKTAARLILDYLHDRYHPIFRRGVIVHCEDGEELKMQTACVPNSEILARLARAGDAPRDKHGVNVDGLPMFFRKWAPVAWGDLLQGLPDEMKAVMGEDAPARETFARLVREAMFSFKTFGDVIGRQGVSQTESRSIIGWCAKFAKIGPWRDLRSVVCWCKLREGPGGELQLCVAIRHELLAQVAADRRLREIGPTMFARLCNKYAIGISSEKDRPGGRKAIVLSDAFVNDMTAGIPDEEDLPPATDSDGQAGVGATGSEGVSA